MSDSPTQKAPSSNRQPIRKFAEKWGVSVRTVKVGYEVTKYPDHLTDKRGRKMWTAVMEQMDLLNARRKGSAS